MVKWQKSERESSLHSISLRTNQFIENKKAVTVTLETV